MNMADPKLPNHHISSTWKDHCRNQNFIRITDLIGNRHNPKNKIYYCEDLYTKNKKDHRCRFLNGTHPNALGHQKIAEHIISAINISE
jgi:lysophospholipase L1-like esterase